MSENKEESADILTEDPAELAVFSVPDELPMVFIALKRKVATVIVRCQFIRSS